MYIFAFVRIEEELKLDYSDVLFRPKRSTLQSRKDVNLKEPIDSDTQIMNGQEYQLWLQIWMELVSLQLQKRCLNLE